MSNLIKDMMKNYNNYYFASLQSVGVLNSKMSYVGRISVRINSIKFVGFLWRQLAIRYIKIKPVSSRRQCCAILFNKQVIAMMYTKKILKQMIE